ncbi:Citryl-CoA lyase [Pseudonocardia dioxanivorans CB1190]|jgi:citrate lyase subunit beta/citryl-CoA lyase|uniref:Citryl-CoA lyase n=1 Tax=Pseudonocardia dioxanivorans (strain ATCC 55486 / DSM 44775 / JCM 13855 / CB1190) TaxID=675635 RepID=F4CUL7_PSEUX|nr:CoA ester lyase [Pseudonocardia dioxanivorans]AEA26331.1 Citryl-CoA lyase [Pseudonocardia dioxanivorans CB1190]
MTDPRSLLFVPSNRPDRFEKASRSGADAVILDLEDSVGVSQKVASRDNLQQAADLAAAAGQSVYVRVNPVDTEWHTGDLAAAARIGARGVIVPKCEDADVVAGIDRDLAAGLELVLILETAAGVLNAVALARPSDRVRRISFGAYDFALDMGVVPEQAHALMTSSRIHVAMAAVAAGVQPIDTAFADVRDPGAMRRQTEEAHGMGFTGKFAIHPDQVPIVNEVLSPSPAEIDTAQRIVAAFDEAERDGIAAITVDDKLVDYPIAQRAQATLERAAQFGLVAS